MTTRLSEKEIDCLRGVAELKSSKQIARELDVSSHTVDARLKRAIAKLGAADRFDAARMFQAIEDSENSSGPQNARSAAALEAPDASEEEVRTLVYQTPDVPDSAGFGPQAFPSPDGAGGDGNDSTRLRDSAFAADWADHSSYLPIPRHRGERNELTALQRLGWIVSIAVGSVIIFGGLMGGLSALSTLFS